MRLFIEGGVISLIGASYSVDSGEVDLQDDTYTCGEIGHLDLDMGAVGRS